MVRQWAEATLNAMLEAEADAQCGAKRYERTPERVGHTDWALRTKVVDVLGAR